MDGKWFTNSVVALTMLFTGWSACSDYKQADAAVKSLQGKPQEISEHIEINEKKLNLNKNMVDSIIVNKKNDDLLFSIVNATITDYDLGKYDIYSNPNVRNTLKVIKKEIDKYFLNKKNENVYLLIWAKGRADNTKVSYNTFYTGKSIEETIEYYYEDDKCFQNKQTVDFINGLTRMKNEYYAVLRAYYIVKDLQKKYPNTDKNQIKIIAKEYNQIGQQFRGCDIQIAVKNAFKNPYDELGFGARKFIEWGWVK